MDTILSIVTAKTVHNNYTKKQQLMLNRQHGSYHIAHSDLQYIH